MKAEHRKELQTNTLADHLGKWLQGMKSRPSTGSVVVWVFVAAALALFIGWRFYSKSQEKERSQLWVELGEIARPEQLEEFGNEHGKTMPGRVSRFQRARVLLSNGLQRLCSEEERPRALKNLEEAEELYRQLAGESKDTPHLQAEALMGIATSLEARGKLDDAKAAYEDLAKRFPNHPRGIAAAARVEDLNKNAKLPGFYEKLDELASAKAKPSTP